MKKILLYILCSLCFVLPSMGQNHFGRVLDNSHNPIVGAEIMLLTKDTIFISSTIADENGAFSIASNINGNLLKISSIGYKNKYLKISTFVNNDVLLDEDTNLLSEITVTGERPKSFMGKEGLVTQIHGTALSKVGTAGELLTYLPNVIETDGVYSVFGSQGAPLIYINGKKVRNNKELQLLKSSDIQSVEIIFSPSAKYDATVNSIIKIKTIKPIGDGLSGSVETQISQAHKLNSYEDINLNYRIKGLDISTDLSHEYSDRYQSQTSILEMSKIANRSLDGNITSCTNDWYGQFRTNYTFNDRHCLGITYEIERQQLDGYANLKSYVIKPNSTVENLSYNNLINTNKGTDHSLGIYYNGMLGELNIDLNADYLYSPQNTTHNISIEDQPTHRQVSSSNPESNRLLAAKLDMSYPIGNGQLSWGYEQTNTKRKDKFISSGGIESNSNYDIHENSLSGYAEYKFEIKHFSTSAGLRYEYTHANYWQLNENGNDINNSYHGIYPNISMLYSAKSFMSRIIFSIKTQRPSYGNLSADRQYDDDYLYEGGNPYLLPSKTTDIALESKYRCLFVRASFSSIHNDIMMFDQIYGDKAALITYINLPNREKINFNFGINKTIGIWTPNYSIALDKQFLNVNTLGLSHKFNDPIWMMKFYNHLQLPYNIDLYVNFLYMSKGDNYNMISQEKNRFSVMLQKSFFNNSLNIKIKADDIFKGYYNKVEYYGANIYFNKNNYSDTRNVSITVSYNFNSDDSKYKGTGAGNDEKNRL